MKKNFLLAWALLIICLAAVSSCATSRKAEGRNVAYKVANRYFFRNDATIPQDARITTKEQFESLFGMATVMGNDGQPTVIDFSKEFVIAVVLPETWNATELFPVSLRDSGSALTLNYRQTVGEKRSYSIQPCMLIIVDKNYERRKVVLNAEMKEEKK